tara:strand:+ start:172 stop:342 length:171 start_codon:yes stop_codon:yes gene_type:complete
MRNDYKSWKKGVQRVGKQLGGMLTRPLGGIGASLARARPLGFKKGSKPSNVYNKKK